MKVILIGGTGFLGYHAGLEFLRRNHRVTALGLPPLPLDTEYQQRVSFVTLNLETASDQQLLDHFSGQEVLIYAAGADDKVTPKKPAYPFFYHHNVEVTGRVLKLAKQAGIRRAVVLGSYFAHFNRAWPHLKLAEKHPYIRSREQQEKTCFELSSDDFKVMVLELPYIFGSMAGRVPLWKPLVEMARGGQVFFCTGGTNCVSVKSVAEAIVGAAEQGEGGQAYLVGDENLTWEQMFQGFGRGLGREVKVFTLPTLALQAALFFVQVSHQLKGLESGLDPLQYSHVQSAETYFDPTPAQKALGYSRGGLEQAFKDTVQACS